MPDSVPPRAGHGKRYNGGMPVITRISEQKQRPNRRNIFLDGKFAFGCNVNVVARFRLVEGMTLSDQQVTEIQQGEVWQEAFDAALDFLGRRMHSRAELSRKLLRREYGPETVQSVLDELERLGYVNDERFAAAKAQSAAERRHHGPRRAMMELRKSGVTNETARAALEQVFNTHDSLATARALVEKQAPRLRRLDPIVARRRIFGMLQRRGFEYETIKPIVDEYLRE